MTFETVRIEGSIFTEDILAKIAAEDSRGQSPKEFNLEQGVKVKDEIAAAWTDVQELWHIFKRQKDRLKETVSGASETRDFWMKPLLRLLGYNLQYEAKGEVVNNRNYVIDHRDITIDRFPVMIKGCNESLDKKKGGGGGEVKRSLHMSPHGIVQEYLNFTEHLYALVTNGLSLRVLRDSSRLVKLSFLEFDLHTMMEQNHYADFALMYRLLHVSRMPRKMEDGPESLIEAYHQDSLDSGARIREGLSSAVEHSLKLLGNGFLSHSHNAPLLELVRSEKLSPDEYYRWLLRLIYRMLFLMVIEERHLIYPKDYKSKKRDIYYDYYSITQLRKRCETLRFRQDRHDDLWTGLCHTFKMFEDGDPGKNLDIAPLNGELFGPGALGELTRCRLSNRNLLEALRNLSLFESRATGTMQRVNYGSLNVEEFGSVYEGLLEFKPMLDQNAGIIKFTFHKGDERSTSGSHYTPDELVQPLIRHSLDQIIDEKLKESDKEKALLSIRVCDVACGSGHILLNAARRIGTELARVRTNEEQPSAGALREGIRDAIKDCIYGVDKNPHAVELCKVSLWLEGHTPGQPLNFLDHHIKCGDAIVGLAHMKELEKGIPEEAFKKQQPGDDPKVRASLHKINKKQRDENLGLLTPVQKIKDTIANISAITGRINAMPETTVAERARKKEHFEQLISGPEYKKLLVLANIQVGQFFIPKTEKYLHMLTTHSQFEAYYRGNLPIPQNLEESIAVYSTNRKFFHWFLEFPEILSSGGFDCILGNPPFLGNRKIKSYLGADYLNWLQYYFEAGAIELVGYFFRRIFNLLNTNGFQSLISTNTVAQGAARESSLEVIEKDGGTINFAVRSMKWPGMAAVDISLISIFKGKWSHIFILDNRKVKKISTFLDDQEYLGNPFKLNQNTDKSFIGSYVLGKGFILKSEEANALIEKNQKNNEVIFPYLNGDDLNSRPNQSARRWIINFFDWSEETAESDYPDCFEIIKEKVKNERQRKNDKGEYILRKPLPQKWWQYADKRPKLYKKLKGLDRVIVVVLHSKLCIFSFNDPTLVFSHALGIIVFNKFSQFAVLQSEFHVHWAWKYSSTLRDAGIRYSPSSCFETFPFPQGMTGEMEQQLETIGEQYHEFRKQLMLKLQLGLTKTYNLFHKKDLSIDDVRKESKQDENTSTSGYKDIIKLRELHKTMDLTVLYAYGWSDIDLAHDFYEVDYLPENDRIRYTISPDSRKEILKRLLLLNHQIHRHEKDGTPLDIPKPPPQPGDQKQPSQPHLTGLLIKNEHYPKDDDPEIPEIMEIIKKGEGQTIEFKSTLRWDMKRKTINKDLQFEVIETVAAFLNTDGGDLLIGVADNGDIVGLQHDYKTYGKKKGRDNFDTHLASVIFDNVGRYNSIFVKYSFHKIDGKDICRVNVEPGDNAVYITENKQEKLFKRIGASSRQLSISDAIAYVNKRFGKID